MDHVYFGGQGGIRDKTEDRFGISMAVLLSVGQVNDLYTGQVNDRYRYCERGTREDMDQFCVSIDMPVIFCYA